MSVVSILAEAGLSECGRTPETAVCKEMNIDLTMALLVVPSFLVVWVEVALTESSSDWLSNVPRVGKFKWTAVAWLIPIGGAVAWFVLRPRHPAEGSKGPRTIR